MQEIRTKALHEAIELLTQRAAELSELAEEREGCELEERAQEWHRAADAVRSLIHRPVPAVDQADLDERRAELIEAMRGVSEDRWCAGWLMGLESRLHAEGGIWETLGRSIGWPTGAYNKWTWVTWEEATALFADAAKGSKQELLP